MNFVANQESDILQGGYDFEALGIEYNGTALNTDCPLGAIKSKPPLAPLCVSIRCADCLLNPLQGENWTSSSLVKGRLGGV